jgi:hypothetical protein
MFVPSFLHIFKDYFGDSVRDKSETVFDDSLHYKQFIFMIDLTELFEVGCKLGARVHESLAILEYTYIMNEL